MSHNSSNASLSETSSVAEGAAGEDHDSSSSEGRTILSGKYLQESRGKVRLSLAWLLFLDVRSESAISMFGTRQCHP